MSGLLIFLLGFTSCVWTASGIAGWWLMKRYAPALTPGDTLRSLSFCVALPPLFLWSVIDCILNPERTT